MKQCEVCFLDCMGNWDLVSEVVSITLMGFVIFKTVVNIKNLNYERQVLEDVQAKKSLVRKTIVNYMSLIYQCFLSFSILSSVVIFLIYRDDIRQAGEHKINLWYKWSEIIFINLLNCLNLTIGFLYWKAVRAFFKISQQPLPIIYFRFAKFIFFAFYIINLLIIIVSLVMLLVTDQTHYEKYEIKIINALNSLTVGCSTTICLATRLLYQKHILNNLRMNRATINKERLYSLLIAFSSCCRLVCMALNLAGIDYSLPLRDFDSECMDVSYLHAIMMFVVTVWINMVPPFIFSLIFASSQGLRNNFVEQKESLCKYDESVRYV